MNTQPRQRMRDRGESLIEVLMTVMLIGLTVTAFLAALATTGNAGNMHRVSVQADTVIRDYAEATKTAVAAGCVVGTDTYSVSYLAVGFTLSGAGNDCPDPAAVVTAERIQTLHLTVSGPLGVTETLDIKVRTP